MEAFVLLALLAHGLFFGVVHISASSFSRRYDDSRLIPVENVPPDIQNALNNAENSQKIHKNRLVPVIVATPEIMVVIPVPADSQPRWIVDLLDIPHEEEPRNARFVSERPSRVEEELQAEITSRKPKKHSKRKSEASTEQENSSQPAQAVNPRRTARRSHRSEEQPAPEQPRQTAANIENQNQPQSQEPRIREGENGNLPVAENQGEDIPKKATQPKNVNLLPTYGELAHGQPAANNAPGIPGDHPAPVPPAHKTPGLKNEENGVPGVAEAPENFIPFVKKRGNITLLNAKSYKYASFVRRLAYRMFDRFVVGFHPEAYFGANWPRIEQGASIEAVMNLNGRLVNLKVNRNTGNSRFDSLASNSVRQEAWDNNIPEGAECSDGFVHFIFMPRVIPSDPIDSPQGRVYNSYLIIAIAGLQDCE